MQLDRVPVRQAARQLPLEQAAQLAPLSRLGVEAIQGGVGLLVAGLEAQHPLVGGDGVVAAAERNRQRADLQAQRRLGSGAVAQQLRPPLQHVQQGRLVIGPTVQAVQGDQGVAVIGRALEDLAVPLGGQRLVAQVLRPAGQRAGDPQPDGVVEDVAPRSAGKGRRPAGRCRRRRRSAARSCRADRAAAAPPARPGWPRSRTPAPPTARSSFSSWRRASRTRWFIRSRGSWSAAM